MDEASLRSQIAQNIRIYRAKHNITQEQLANMCNTTQQYINQIENEKLQLVFILY
ncbi:MAG: helix-turn-helix domain-containing protein [Candidatus Melainabacteria bacterium]|nr:MAG: helix-turn-helix domain-containing protein [Candidatus Melainabacteria bacterium]